MVLKRKNPPTSTGPVAPAPVAAPVPVIAPIPAAAPPVLGVPSFIPGPSTNIPIPTVVNVTPPDQNQSLNFWRVDCRIFELTSFLVQSDQFLFERTATTQLNNDITRFLIQGHRLLTIRGPPGVGKSVQTLARLLREFSAPRNAMFMVFLPKMHNNAAKLEGHVFQYVDGVSVNKSSFSFLFSDIVEACIANNCDLALIDNLTENNVGIANLCGQRLKKTVVVSSLPVVLQDTPAFKDCKVRDGWTLEEYISACSYQPFYQLVFDMFDGATATDDAPTRAQLLSDKFSLAGHSARYMFCYNSSDLYDKLLQVVERVPHDFPDQMKDSTSTSVNSALSRMGGVPVLVSSALAKMLGSKFKDSLVSASRALLALRNNPDADGVLFETDFFIHLGRDEHTVQHPIVTVKRTVDQGNPIQLTSGQMNQVCQYFNPTQANTNHPEVFAQVSPAELGAVHWFAPLIVNNAGFDFVQWERTSVPTVQGGPTVGVLRFIQATRALTHSFRKDLYNKFYTMFVARYVTGLNLNLQITCEVYFVVPDGIVNQFTVNAGETDGTLTGFTDGSELIVGFQRIGG